jgi:predicted HTH transcriptional regulator
MVEITHTEEVSTPAPKTGTKRTRNAKSAKQKPRSNTAKSSGRLMNKKTMIIALLQRTKGATLAEIMKTTGWQAHTVRGFISNLNNKGGLKINSYPNNAGQRAYRIAN